MNRIAICVSILLLCLSSGAIALAPSVDLQIKTQKDFYRAGDEFRVNLKAWNPGVARAANLYIWVTGPDLKNYYMPDWSEMKHPWVYDLFIDGGLNFGPATIYETTLPDNSFPIWQPGQYQICAELVDPATNDPLGPFSMAGFGVKRGIVELLYDQDRIQDVEAYRNEIWTAGPGGVVKWWKEGGLWEYEQFTRLDGMSDTYMTQMYADQFGNLIIWPYIGYGLTVYDGHSFTSLFADRRFIVRGIVTDRDMNMWVAAWAGIYKISRNGEIRLCGEEDGLPAFCSGVAIALDPQSYPIVVMRDIMSGSYFLCGYDGQNWWTIPFPFDWIDENGEDLMQGVRCMTVDLRGHVWFGTVVGALEFDGSTTTRYTGENSALAGNNVYKMKLDSTGKVWFVCYSDTLVDGGLCSYDGENWGGLPGLDYADVTGLAVAFDGTLGIGRLLEGLCIMEPGDIPTIHRTEGPKVGYPRPDLAWGPDGTIYLPDWEKGLWGHHDGMWNLMTSENGLATDSTTAIDFDSHGVGWIGSRCGATRWEGDVFTTFNAENGLATDSVQEIAIDASDQPWLIAGQYPDYTLYHYDGSSWQDHSQDLGMPSLPWKIATDTPWRRSIAETQSMK